MRKGQPLGRRGAWGGGSVSLAGQEAVGLGTEGRVLSPGTPTSGLGALCGWRGLVHCRTLNRTPGCHSLSQWQHLSSCDN